MLQVSNTQVLRPNGSRILDTEQAFWEGVLLKEHDISLPQGRELKITKVKAEEERTFQTMIFPEPGEEKQDQRSPWYTAISAGGFQEFRGKKNC